MALDGNPGAARVYPIMFVVVAFLAAGGNRVA
jgi:hypothetical protein